MEQQLLLQLMVVSAEEYFLFYLKDVCPCFPVPFCHAVSSLCFSLALLKHQIYFFITNLSCQQVDA